MKPLVLTTLAAALAAGAGCSRTDDTPWPENAMQARAHQEAIANARDSYTTTELRNEYRTSVEQRILGIDSQIRDLGYSPSDPRSKPIQEARLDVKRAHEKLVDASYDEWAQAKNELENALDRLDTAIAKSMETPETDVRAKR